MGWERLIDECGETEIKREFKEEKQIEVSIYDSFYLHRNNSTFPYTDLPYQCSHLFYILLYI